MNGKPAHKHVGLYLIFAMLFLLAVSAVLVVLTTPVVGGAQGSAMLVSTPTIPPETVCAEFFLLGTEVPLGKRMRQEPAYRNCVQALSSPPPPPGAVNRFPKGTPPPTSFAVLSRKQAGAGTIIDDPGPTFGSSWMVENEWYAEVGTKRIIVYSVTHRGDGAMPLPPPWEAGLVIEVTSLDGATAYPSEQGTFSLPGKPGSVKIVDAVGQRLILKGQSGNTFYFDVPTRKFVSTVDTPTPGKPPTKPPYP